MTVAEKATVQEENKQPIAIKEDIACGNAMALLLEAAAQMKTMASNGIILAPQT